MCAWDEWAAQAEQQQAGMPGQQDRATPIIASSGGVRARLIAQIHGEQQDADVALSVDMMVCDGMYLTDAAAHLLVVTTSACEP
jgi:hypothetical protein